MKPNAFIFLMKYNTSRCVLHTLRLNEAQMLKCINLKFFLLATHRMRAAHSTEEDDINEKLVSKSSDGVVEVGASVSENL